MTERCYRLMAAIAGLIRLTGVDGRSHQPSRRPPTAQDVERAVSGGRGSARRGRRVPRPAGRPPRPASARARAPRRRRRRGWSDASRDAGQSDVATALAHGEQRADQRAHHRVAERVGADPADDLGARAGDAEVQHRPPRRRALAPPAERGEVVQPDAATLAAAAIAATSSARRWSRTKPRRSGSTPPDGRSGTRSAATARRTARRTPAGTSRTDAHEHVRGQHAGEPPSRGRPARPGRRSAPPARWRARPRPSGRRPSATTAGSRSTVASASWSTPCTVRRPGCTAQPEKPVPS